MRELIRGTQRSEPSDLLTSQPVQLSRPKGQWHHQAKVAELEMRKTREEF